MVRSSPRSQSNGEADVLISQKSTHPMGWIASPKRSPRINSTARV
jgi:hypothetical protein